MSFGSTCTFAMRLSYVYVDKFINLIILPLDFDRKLEGLSSARLSGNSSMSSASSSSVTPLSV